MKKIKIKEGVYTVEPEKQNEALYWGASFFDHDDLEELFIPESITKIEKSGLAYCDNLKKVHMPVTVEYLGDGIFYGLRQTIEIYYDGTAEQFIKISKRTVIKDVQVPGKYDVQPYCNSEGTYYKKEKVVESFDHFCADCKVICADGQVLSYGYKSITNY